MSDSSDPGLQILNVDPLLKVGNKRGSRKKIIGVETEVDAVAS